MSPVAAAAPSTDRPHHRFWPKRLPHAITPPATSLWPNLVVSAMRYPDKPALVFFDRTTTYRDLLAQAERLAAHLRAQGVQDGDRVIVFMQNCPQWVVAHYAILRANAVVVPVNPMNRAEELKHYITDPDVKVAISAADLAGDLLKANAELPAAQRLSHLIPMKRPGTAQEIAAAIVGCTAALLFAFLPLMVLPLFATIERFDMRLLEASYDLYASRWVILREIVLPIVKPGIVAGCILVFVPSLGAFLARLGIARVELDVPPFATPEVFAVDVGVRAAHAAPMEALRVAARLIQSLNPKPGLALIEDAACAIGSEILWDGRWERVGKPHGDVACFSFHPRKVMSTGDGGMITTRHGDWDRRFRLLRQHAMSVPDTVRHGASYPIVTLV